MILIALGVIFLAEQMGARWGLHHNWPILLMVIGAAQIFAQRGESIRGGIWLLFIGGICMLTSWNIMSWDKAWPLFIIAGGVAIMIPSQRGQPRE